MGVPVPRRLLAVALSALLAAAPVPGCKRRSVTGELASGSGIPVLLASGDAIRLPAPPDAESDQQRKETDELITLQERRTARTRGTVGFWAAGAVVRWNAIARDLVAKHRTEPPMASRVYALLSVAQYDALVAAWNNKRFYKRPGPPMASSILTPLAAASANPAYPCEHATVAASSAAVLAHLYPEEAEFLEGKVAEHEDSRLSGALSFRSDVAAGDSLGRDVATIVIGYARRDGSDRVWTGSAPRGKDRWLSAPSRAPVLPLWGQVEPWLTGSGSRFRAGPPPAYGSREFQDALTEVKRLSETRTREQARIAALWADGLGSYTPSGRWNKIAADLIRKHELSEVGAARVFALLNMAMMDAGIASWDTKYHYWTVRPSQVDPSITTPVGLPNFPAYASAHSAFSSAGAGVLGWLFPDESDLLRAKAEEASVSRLYGGIHYRFDLVAGAAQGRAIAELAIQRSQSKGSP